ncbi:hypothetical protein WJX73_001494 [Symbiochloris irregularis]|uniref:Uncharacterized protein n=1 Tax=Symbiochloris irregularis TaxID=706552 RepID=A0AAW1PXJ7_9CHLO
MSLKLTSRCGRALDTVRFAGIFNCWLHNLYLHCLPVCPDASKEGSVHLARLPLALSERYRYWSLTWSPLKATSKVRAVETAADSLFISVAALTAPV